MTSKRLIFIALITILTSCNDMSIEQNEEETPLYVSIETDARIVDLKNSLGVQKRVRNSRSAQEVLDLADWTRVNVFEKPSEEKIVYTIPMLNSLPTQKLQLVIIEQEDDLEPFVIQYEPSEDWLNDLVFREANPIDGRIEFQTLEGEVTRETLDKNISGKRNGKSGCDCQMIAFRVVNYGAVGEGDLFPIYNYEFVEVCDCTGSGPTDAGAPESAEGGSGNPGGSKDPDFVILGEGNCVGGYENINNICVPPCGDGEIRVGWNCINEAELWEEDIKDKNLDPCVSQILDDLKGSKKDIGKFIDEIAQSKYFRWELKSGDIPDDDCDGTTNAITSLNDNQAITTVDINKMSGATKLATAAVLIHESVHAYEALAFGGLTSIPGDNCKMQETEWFVEAINDVTRRLEILNTIEVELTGKDLNGNRKQQSTPQNDC